MMNFPSQILSVPIEFFTATPRALYKYGKGWSNEQGWCHDQVHYEDLLQVCRKKVPQEYLISTCLPTLLGVIYALYKKLWKHSP